VDLVLGERWAGAVPIFRALAPAALMATTNTATGWVYLSWGHVGRQLRWGVVSSIILVLGMALGLRYGAMGVAIAVSVTRVGMKLPGLWYCYLDTPLRLRHFFAAVWRSMLAAAVAGGALVVLRDGFDGSFEVPVVVELAGLFAAYGVGYATCLVAIPGGLSRLLAIRDALTGSRTRPPSGAEPR
jgi:O-antigen/teichoic acid export membrane protein